VSVAAWTDRAGGVIAEPLIEETVTPLCSLILSDNKQAGRGIRGRVAPGIGSETHIETPVMTPTTTATWQPPPFLARSSSGA
jgi:hypothetical protein